MKKKFKFLIIITTTNLFICQKLAFFIIANSKKNDIIYKIERLYQNFEGFLAYHGHI